MILVASSRGGGSALASHLTNVADNEHVEIHDMRGFVSEDLDGAFKEAQAISRATKCKKYLFSLSLNPPQNEAVGIEVFEDAIRRIEKSLDLADLPRAIVFHEKKGRRHAHVVWSRIDGSQLKARKLPYFKLRLQDISRELYLEHKWNMPQGLLNRGLSNPLNFTLAEWQQAKRSGTDPRLVKAAIQRCWQSSDNVNSLKAALQDYGFTLAQGDRRGFVVIDARGGVYALARASGVKSKEISARLGEAKQLPSAQDVLNAVSESNDQKLQSHVKTAKDDFAASSNALMVRKKEMIAAHREQRADLSKKHNKRAQQEAKNRAAQLPRGLKAVWSFLSGNRRKLKAGLDADAVRCLNRDKSEKETLVQKQLKERLILQQRLGALRGDQARLLWALRDERHQNRHLTKYSPQESNSQKRRRTM